MDDNIPTKENFTMSKPVGNFCEGCPLANGVAEISETFLSSFSCDSDIGGFNILLIDASDENVRSQKIHADITGDYLDSSMSSGTFRSVVDKVKQCNGPSETTVKRLGGLLGSKAIKGCGAFPDQNPSKVRVSAEDTGWFNPLDF